MEYERMSREQRLEQEARALYQFFRNAEINQTRFTYDDIRIYFPRSDVGPYARQLWSWFLRPEPHQPGRKKYFTCQGIKNYREEYFVEAHKPQRAKYFHAFAVAIEAEKKRKDALRDAKLQAGILLPSPVEDIQQDAPEEVTLARIEEDEEELPFVATPAVLTNVPDVPGTPNLPFVDPHPPLGDDQPPTISREWVLFWTAICAIIAFWFIVDYLRP
jgi:hypothetical protein